MRGEERQQRSMLMVLNVEQRVPQDHPLRRIKQLAETVLQRLSASFDRMYSATGRPSIPPERLLKASLLMALYTVRSERLLCEQLDYNLLFRWFLEMELEGAALEPPALAEEVAVRALLLMDITQGPCSALQIGGSNNQAAGGNCAPLPLKLT